MSKIDDGSPAFPHPSVSVTQHGMSLRDWFAGPALIGLIQHNPHSFEARKDKNHQDGVASLSYRFADAMLAERKKEKPCPPT